MLQTQTKKFDQKIYLLLLFCFVNRNAATDMVDQELIFVGSESNNGKLQALRNLVHKGVLPPVLIFVQSKERAQELFNELCFDDYKVDAIHSGRTQQQVMF